MLPVFACTVSLAALSSVLSPTASASFTHKLDNGVGASGGGCNTSSDSVVEWANQFTATAGTVVNQVEVAFGAVAGADAVLDSSGMIGRPVTITIYDDPDNNGSPSDLEVLTQVVRTIGNYQSDTFDVFTIPDTPVSGKFFVSAAVEVPGQATTGDTSNYNPIRVDAGPSNQRTWVRAVCTANGDWFKLHPQFAGNAMLRAGIDVTDKYAVLEDGMRALFMGGNWGDNRVLIDNPPPEYFSWLKGNNANWMGISVSLHYDDSLDSTVERNYTAQIPTFQDEQLINLISMAKTEGIKVYLTLAFEAVEAETSAFPLKRWMLGQPEEVEFLPGVDPANWPWAPDHPNHEAFVAEFWRTYTDQAVHFAKLAQNAGVEMYSLGTETERLFRTRSGGRWTTEFRDELETMVSEVREVYSGLLTYDMTYEALTSRQFFGVGSDHLWEDLDLDVLGVSSYFPLTDSLPTQPLSVDALETIWEGVFAENLIPLSERNPEKPVVLLEFGYVDSVGSPFKANTDEFTEKQFADANSNGLDDGEETQRNTIEAFFTVREQYADTVIGAFLWDNSLTTDEQWSLFFETVRGFSIRGKLAEEMVRNEYASWVFDAGVWLDSDRDGVRDNDDPFPLDSNESMDSDADGVGDNADAFPLDPAASVDSDNDGAPDAWNPGFDQSGSTSSPQLILDAFPTDPAEQRDTDSDGLGDNAENSLGTNPASPDSDGDGFSDKEELEAQSDPLDPADAPSMLELPVWMLEVLRSQGSD